MFGQLFGNYLLNKAWITPAQLKEALDEQKNARVKIGVLAVNSGYMTADQISEVHNMQMKVDKRFGEIAIELNYLTSEQLEELLATQKQDYLLLGQVLVDKGYLTYNQFEKALSEYKREFSLSEEQFKVVQQGNTDALVKLYLEIPNEIYVDYISLFIRNIVRFIDTTVCIEESFELDELQASNLVYQQIKGYPNIFTGLVLDDNVLLDIASRFSGEQLNLGDELVEGSIGEFLNLHNGIFLINMSNNGIELQMDSQSLNGFCNVKNKSGGYVIPFTINSGKFYLVLAENITVF
ncbi:MAG: hypothetical protein PHC44_07035 [Lutispora sp.]|nr:hypothetical protein [Lutispora sp.]MDD4834471.1 hypothetical protein [Lutispora sp.]